MTATVPAQCEAHTPCPEGYEARAAWADRMSDTHVQRECRGCGLYVIWEPRRLPGMPTAAVLSVAFTETGDAS